MKRSIEGEARPAEATERMAHDDPRTTQVVYRRKPRRAIAGRKILDTHPNIRQRARFEASQVFE